MDQQSHYVGLDVSLETTSICVIDDAGAIIWRGKCSSDPDTITAIVRQHAPGTVRVGLETGQLSNWLTLSLRRRGLPVVCMDARHAKAALSLPINKTDANDAFGTAQATANPIRGLLKTFGLVVARGSKGLFPVRVREQTAGNPALIAIIEPLLAVWSAIREQVTMLDRQILARARNDQVARRLMTIPGVGVVIALAYTAVIDDPARFRRSVSVGAYLGLTPRRYQSGEVDTTGHISKCGDSLLRGYLYEAAALLLYRDGRASILKSWGLGLAKRIGMRRAKVAVARKLAVIMHRIWSDQSEYRWTAIPSTTV